MIKIRKGRGADRAGIREGDYIMAVNGITVRQHGVAIAVLEEHGKAGDLQLTFRRPVTKGPLNASSPAGAWVLPSGGPWPIGSGGSTEAPLSPHEERRDGGKERLAGFAMVGAHIELDQRARTLVVDARYPGPDHDVAAGLDAIEEIETLLPVHDLVDLVVSRVEAGMGPRSGLIGHHTRQHTGGKDHLGVVDRFFGDECELFEPRPQRERIEAAVVRLPADPLGLGLEAHAVEVHRQDRPPPASMSSIVGPR